MTYEFLGGNSSGSRENWKISSGNTVMSSLHGRDSELASRYIAPRISLLIPRELTKLGRSLYTA